MEAEKKVADAAKEGLHRKLAEAEARVSSMLDTVEDLRSGLAEQQQEAGARYQPNQLVTAGHVMWGDVRSECIHTGLWTRAVVQLSPA